jgi:hypothetical protein
MKTCSRCKINKPKNEFGVSKNSKDGLRSECKSCRNKDERNDRVYKKPKKPRISQKNNKPEYLICNSCGVEKKFNTDNFISDKYRCFSLTTICKVCKQKNKSEDKTYKIRRLRYYSKPENKMKRAIHDIIKRTLKYKNENHVNKDLGYSKHELMEHLEKQFTEGMSWENYGTWHIDHIIPITKFDASVPIYIINHLENLQPLDGAENISKNNRIELIPERIIAEYVLVLNENNKYQLK